MTDDRPMKDTGAKQAGPPPELPEIVWRVGDEERHTYRLTRGEAMLLEQLHGTGLFGKTRLATLIECVDQVLRKKAGEGWFE